MFNFNNKDKDKDVIDTNGVTLMSLLLTLNIFHIIF